MPKITDDDYSVLNKAGGAAIERIEKRLDALESAYFEQRPAHCSFTMEELDYLARLVAVDHQRMIQDADHAIAYGARGYQWPPAAELAGRLTHSFNMARTAAALAAIEDMEKSRADSPGGSI